jgi:signal transduction histidine kinase
MWKRVVWPTALTSLLWLVLGWTSTRYLEESHLAREQAPFQMEAAIWRMQSLLSPTPGQGGRRDISALNQEAQAFERILAECAKGPQTSATARQIEEIRARFGDYRQQLRHVAAASGLRGSPDADFLPGPSADLAATIATDCRRLAALEQPPSTLWAYTQDRWYSQVAMGRMLLFVVGPFVGVLLAVWAERDQKRLIRQICLDLRNFTSNLREELGMIEVPPSCDLPELKEQVRLISDRLVKAFRELDQARESAIRTERLAAVGELATSAAHELRNPLTSVKLLIQTAARKASDPPFNGKQFQILQDEIIRMEETIQHLMDLGRPLRPKRSQLDLHMPVRGAMKFVQSRASRHGIELVEELSDAPAWVFGDLGQLQQVYLNLLLRGMDRMPEGGTLRVTLNRSEAQNPTCRLEIAKAMQTECAAQPESASGSSSEAPDPGPGIGLAYCHHIIRAHGGTLTERLGLESGTLFTVELPLMTQVLEQTPTLH